MAFRSKLEENVADLLQGLGVSYEYESTKVPYIIRHNYTPDFVLASGIFLETKGYWDADDRRKILAVKKSNPELDIRMVFQAPYNRISKKSKTTYAQWCNKISKGSKTTYAKWCDKHNIPWTSFTEIPIDWLT